MTEKSSNMTITAGVEAGGDVVDYITLLKPRVMSLVVFTGFAGLFLAPGSIHPVIGAVAVLCIAVGAGASGAINMWYDRDIDAVMTRTAERPVPQRTGRGSGIWCRTSGLVCNGDGYCRRLDSCGSISLYDRLLCFYLYYVA